MMQIDPALIQNNPNRSDDAQELLGGSGWAGWNRVEQIRGKERPGGPSHITPPQPFNLKAIAVASTCVSEASSARH